MSVRLIKKSDDGTICANSMKNGQLAEIVKWPNGMYVGETIQRCGSRLDMIGRDIVLSVALDSRDDDRRVRLLEPGELIEVIENSGK